MFLKAFSGDNFGSKIALVREEEEEKRDAEQLTSLLIDSHTSEYVSSHIE